MFLAVGVVCSAQAGVYRWTDAQGRTHFSDTPPVGKTSRALDLPSNTVASPRPVAPAARGIPPAPGVQAARPLPRVVIYTATWCGYCRAAKATLAQRHVPYTEFDVETSRQGQRDYEQMGSPGVPITLIGDRAVYGYTLGQFNAALSSAGYP